MLHARLNSHLVLDHQDHLKPVGNLVMLSYYNGKAKRNGFFWTVI